MRIHPVAIGVANAVLPGIGYVVIGVRKTFGWLLLAGSVACLIVSALEPGFLSQSFFTSSTTIGKVFEFIWYVCFMLAYGYDAWNLADAKRKMDMSMVETKTVEEAPVAKTDEPIENSPKETVQEVPEPTV